MPMRKTANVIVDFEGVKERNLRASTPFPHLANVLCVV